MASPVPGPVPFHQIPQNLRLPLFWAEVDPSQANTNQQNQRSLILGQLVTPAVNTATTNATTASSSAILHFVAGPPAGVKIGDLIFDATSPAVIAAGTTVLSIDTVGHTITMSTNALSAGVGGTDVINFLRPLAGSVMLSAVTNASASSGSSLGFAAQPPGVKVGMFVFDLSTPAAFAEGGTVTSVGATVLISNTITGTVGNGDIILFVDMSPRLVQSASQAAGLYGIGSMLVDGVDRYRQNDAFGELWCVGIPDDLSATAATGSITISGAATSQGTLSVYVNGVLVPVVITTTMTPTNIATALAAAVNSAIDASSQNLLPITATASAGVVTLTARMGGLAGNNIDVRLNYYGSANGEVTPPGLIVTIAAMAGGATNPTTVLTAVLSTLGSIPYDFIGHPWTDATSLNAFQAFMNDTSGRWAWLDQIYGHCFTAADAMSGALVTLGTARNDQHHTIWGLYACPSAPWQRAYALTAAAATSARADPGQPLHSISLNGILPPKASDQFIASINNTLVFDGISVSTVVAGIVETLLVITTYQLNPSGTPDNSYLKVETMMLLTAILRYLRSRITSKFSRMKLADDGTAIPANSNIVTPNIIRGDQIAAYSDMVGFGWVQDFDQFAVTVSVVRNAMNPNRVDVLWPGILINQLDVVALLAQFRLMGNPALAQAA